LLHVVTLHLQLLQDPTDCSWLHIVGRFRNRTQLASQKILLTAEFDKEYERMNPKIEKELQRPLFAPDAASTAANS
jgi:hypothetical protein